MSTPSRDRKSRTASKQDRPGRTRRARDSLSRQVILDAAETIAARDGLDGLTFQALGKELTAHPTSIYRHFRDKDELVLELIDNLRSRSYGGQLEATDSWRDDLRSLAYHIHEHYLRYPQFALQMAARTTRRPTEFTNVEFALDAFLRAGLPPHDAAIFLRVFGNVIRSLSSMEAGLHALEAETRERDALAWHLEYRRLAPEEYPRIASMSDQLTDIGDPRVFDTAIELFLDAIEVRARKADGEGGQGT
ncbi:TetR/AcrR family transcriptional regulator [Wenjunlia tyrosinilytica]|uniref:TetR family transcriptional regulator n=1 Tax=Wenjunlia tyrosinilytica TaxID=1544741 RepID=A0A917ZTM6_9ACTN|nr:TetR/AcrR family transcriptional regulator [Wenjunlia tyrosinilytica]GGO93135.1 TetR family transcriptional regulator [Wenjunlia tyrosinilytica]